MPISLEPYSGADSVWNPFPGGHLPDSQVVAKAPTRLVDLRSPEAFRMGFIPGSYNISDEICMAAARRSGLFSGRDVYLLADDVEQLTLCCNFEDLGPGSEVAGWFGADALEEWRLASSQLGCLDAIGLDTMLIRLASWNTLVVDVAISNEKQPLSHPAALRFMLDELPLSLDGLPEDSSICITAETQSVASYAASLLWNFGFRKISYLAGAAWIRV